MKKADRDRVLSRASLEAVLHHAKAAEGDVYDKAAILLTELTRGHAFASGVTVSFLRANSEHPHVLHDPKILTGVREGFYTKDEVKNWLKGNAIRRFARP